MRVLYLVYFLLLFCFYGCKSKTNDIGVKRLEIRNIQPETKPVINILHQVQRGDTLEIVSDGELTWNPFVIGLAVDSLQSRYGNLFDLERKGNFARLKKGNTFIEVLKNSPLENAEDLAEHHHSTLPIYRLSKAEIFDDGIQLQHGITVGMNKNEFFRLLGYRGDINGINVVQNFDPPGDLIEQTFVFDKDKLLRISMRSPY